MARSVLDRSCKPRNIIPASRLQYVKTLAGNIISVWPLNMNIKHLLSSPSEGYEISYLGYNARETTYKHPTKAHLRKAVSWYLLPPVLQRPQKKKKIAVSALKSTTGTTSTSQFFRVLYGYPSAHGAFFFKSKILRSGSVRF